MRFILGKVRSGKTAAIIEEIRNAVEKQQGRELLIVPEQYSHEAERELCAACGDSLSLYAEVMSFTGLARWSMNRHGGGASLHLDRGGKLLCMAAALRELQPVLRQYERAAEQVDLQEQLLQELETVRAAAADSGFLMNVSEETEGLLSGKLKELAQIMSAYDTVLARSGAMTKEPLQILAEQISRFGLSGFSHVYIDGFIDFTGLEMTVLQALIHSGIPLTVCLPWGSGDRREEYLLPSEMAEKQLRKLAEECGQSVTVQMMGPKPAENNRVLRYFSDRMFDYGAPGGQPSSGEIRLWKAGSPDEECEAAAAEVLRAVREEGCRWRDIALAVRGFEDYRQSLESCFRRYGIPLFLTRRDLLSDKALPVMIDSAYELVLGNWDSEEMTAYLRSGLSGLEDDACDELCSYVFKWQLKRRDWLRSGVWSQHPDGIGREETEESREKLARIESSRRFVAGPLIALMRRATEAETAAEQAKALKEYLRETHMEKRLEEHVLRLEQEGRLELRAEYLQLWDICCEAIRQIEAVLGDSPMDAENFRRLFHTMLAQYDLGMIPVALDRVSAGDFDRMRRRRIRRLILLGCSDERLPSERKNSGIFTSEERDRLAEHGLMVGGGDVELWREYALIMHTLSLPDDSLILSWPLVNRSGEKLLPAFVYRQAERLFDLQPDTVNIRRARLSAYAPALSLAAAAAGAAAGPEEKASEAWFLRNEPERLSTLQQAAGRKRAALSEKTAAELYGRRIRISPSRLNSFASCHFRYYCQYGLKAEEEEPAGFHSPEIGTFMHLILEKTVRDVRELGGFRAVSDSQLLELSRHHIEEYVHTEMEDFREKSRRFRYLFERICGDTEKILLDTAQELRQSAFEPLSFELDISGLGKEIRLEGGSLRKTGTADRVDGWIHEGQLYLRVVDYKTGRKRFSLSDIWYGHDLQMLLYLFSLSEESKALYGMPGKAAGIMYLPAIEPLLSFDRKPGTDEAEQKRQSEKRRTGLLLDEEELIRAWESEEPKQYIPMKAGKTEPLITMTKMGRLQRHVDECLVEMARQLQHGVIEANPVYRSESDFACTNCPYHIICRFEEGKAEEHRREEPRLNDEEVWQLLEDKDSVREADI